MKGLLLSIYRNAGGDCTNGGVSSQHDSALVIGPGIPELFDAGEHPVLRLEQNRSSKNVRLVPVTLDHKWTMFGGNFGYTSDSRFGNAVKALCGYDFYGAVPIHDRVE
jgi:hypothetical protein